jgi:hypothetical protein
VPSRTRPRRRPTTPDGPACITASRITQNPQASAILADSPPSRPRRRPGATSAAVRVDVSVEPVIAQRCRGLLRSAQAAAMENL